MGPLAGPLRIVISLNLTTWTKAPSNCRSGCGRSSHPGQPLCERPGCQNSLILGGLIARLKLAHFPFSRPFSNDWENPMIFGTKVGLLRFTAENLTVPPAVHSCRSSILAASSRWFSSASTQTVKPGLKRTSPRILPRKSCAIFQAVLHTSTGTLACRLGLWTRAGNCPERVGANAMGLIS